MSTLLLTVRGLGASIELQSDLVFQLSSLLVQQPLLDLSLGIDSLTDLCHLLVTNRMSFAQVLLVLGISCWQRPDRRCLLTGQLDLVVLDDLTCDRKRLIAKSLLELSKLDLATRFEPESPRERRVISRNDSI